MRNAGCRSWSGTSPDPRAGLDDVVCARTGGDSGVRVGRSSGPSAERAAALVDFRTAANAPRAAASARPEGPQRLILERTPSTLRSGDFSFLVSEIPRASAAQDAQHANARLQCHCHVCSGRRERVALQSCRWQRPALVHGLRSGAVDVRASARRMRNAVRGRQEPRTVTASGDPATIER